MEAYYHNQATMPHFSGHYRQRGSGFGALAMGIGRVALPLARKFIVPAAKRIGKELLVQAAPEFNRHSNQEENAQTSLEKPQSKKKVGAGRSKSRMSRKRKTATATRKRKTKALIPKKRTSLRSCSNFFTKVRNDF